MDAVTAPPTPQELADPAAARTWRAAQSFEGMAIGELLKPMFDTIDLSKNPFGGGEGEAAWQPMLIQEYAKGMTQHGGIGLAAPVYHEMLRLQEAAREKTQ